MNIKNVILLLILLLAVSSRFIGFGEQYAWANFTPVGAIALFAGTYFKDKKKAFLVPLAILLLSDVLLSYKFTGSFNPYYAGIELVYISFAIMVYFGSMIKKVNVSNVLLASLAAVFIHWILTDIHPWLVGPYTKDFSGYLSALIAAIPFEKNLLYGNLIFSTVMYGSYEIIRAKVPAFKNAYAS
ncbi:hypothetical protein EIM50_17815 [Pseudoxanthomonas sp. SGD-10]|nr:hypothetical protein EIM50_17815 [Pseudoxanthomonas sp. SGD-10]